MKPFLLVTLEYPPHIGGIAVYLSRMAGLLSAEELAVLAPEGSDTHETDMASPVPIYRRRLTWPWFWPKWLPALYWTNRLCREIKPGAILVSHLLPMGHVAYSMKRRHGLPYAVFLHGYDIALIASMGGRKRLLAGRILADADLIVANSEYTARMAEAVGAKPEKMMLAHPCPSFPPYLTVPSETAKETRRSLAADDEFLVLSMGRLVKRKGFETVLRAVAELRQAGQSVRLAIVGDGPDRKRLEKLSAELGIAEAVTFVGFVPTDDIARYYAASDVFVMVPRSEGSDIEGFGIVYLEASSLGKPVIGSRAGGVPEAVLYDRTGLLVNPGDATGLAMAIRRLREEPGLAERLGKAGERRVRDQLQWRLQLRPVLERLSKIAKP